MVRSSHGVLCIPFPEPRESPGPERGSDRDRPADAVPDAADLFRED